MRWLDTVQASACASNRTTLTEHELRGPFKAYRWSVFPGSRFVGHPPTGAPNFGVVDVSSVVYAAPLVPSLEDAHDAADPLYRLNTDAWEITSWPPHLSVWTLTTFGTSPVRARPLEAPMSFRRFRV